MKHKFLILLACVSALVLVSCGDPILPYHSGNYWYEYYIVNGTTSPITIQKEGERYSQNIGAKDTVCIMITGSSNQGEDFTQVHRPTLEEGYEWMVYAGKTYRLTYQDKVYAVDDEQTNSFKYCANYQGNVSDRSVFIYEYYFVIDDAFIATLPQIE